MALTYTAAGVAAGLSGNLVSSAMQNVWVLSAFALLFVVLSMSMFGLYDLHMPAFLRTGATAAGERVRHGGSLGGTAALGALSALVVSPCVAAPLAGALLYISQTRNVVIGAVALFSLALGMGLPLILVGASAGSLLPRAGAWMVAVKSLFGFVLLGVAIWLVSSLLPAWATLACWSALTLALGIYLLTRAVRGTRGRALWLARTFGAAAMTAGLVLGVGTATGARDPLHPFEGLVGATATVARDVPFLRVRDVADLDRALAGARGKYVMLDFYADWCVSCKEMARDTFSDPRVRDHMKDMVLLQADVTANSTADAALLQRFGLFGPPGIVFFDRSGVEMGGRRVVGYQASDRFLGSLDKVLCC